MLGVNPTTHTLWLDTFLDSSGSLIHDPPLLQGSTKHRSDEVSPAAELVDIRYDDVFRDGEVYQRTAYLCRDVPLLAPLDFVEDDQQIYVGVVVRLPTRHDPKTMIFKGSNRSTTRSTIASSHS